jgi:hypothetical protein
MCRPSGLGRVVNCSIVFVLTGVPILIPVARRAFSERSGKISFSSESFSRSSYGSLRLLPVP